MPDRANPFRLAVLWFGIQSVWGAVLGISLQARCLALAGEHALAEYARISITGALAAAAAQLLVGPLSDARRRAGDNRIAFYATGVVVGAVAVVGFYRASSIGSLVVWFALLQFALNVAIGPYQAIVPDVFEPGRIGRASGWMAGMQSAGNAAGAILASFVLAPTALAIALATLLAGSAAWTIGHLARLKLQPLHAVARLAVSRTLVDLFVSRALMYVGFYTLLGYLLFYVRDVLPKGFGVSVQLASGACILAFTLFGTLGASLAARPSDRFDERWIVTAGGAVVSIAIAALAVAGTLPVLPGAIALAGCGWGVFLCADWAFACRTLPAGAMATTMAVWNLAVVIPQVLAPLLATAVLVRAGELAGPNGPRIAFGLAAVEIACGVAWIWRLPPSRAGHNP